ncbi:MULTISPECIES: shikimate dehydrogenase [unclassified Myxococcus]|uniref:shikimate dehydrogenase n=1 Tax=Myxococcus TaxID=32 RepID=UPI001CBB8A71|nr:shikimate dehydrogenase [Myxococcus sp. AS-1-15]MBZ4409280.1 shikimate dehydrogenase [Myxococcus sp. XM-1-1-1]BDT34944.1 shikimate dehydrogenase [Myxococcus sp. MH1]
MTPARRIVTLPPTLLGPDAVHFARGCQRRGADVLEIRTDLHAPDAVDAAALADVLPLLVSERGKPLPPAWVAAAWRVDRDLMDATGQKGPLDAPSGKLLASHHADRQLTTDEALALWSRELPADALVKHVEPMTDPAHLSVLLETQRQLGERFGVSRVTVLGMGAVALPARAVLARNNLLDYVAAGGSWAAAPGQRLLDDAVREWRGADRTTLPAPLRLGIFGTAITHSRSPRIHRQPFDRIDLPEDGPVEAVLDSLVPHYGGFAVTSPFKLRLAKHTGSSLDAINTLVRRGSQWESFNTDTEGARKVLERLDAKDVVILGDGGATSALRTVAAERGQALRVLRRADIQGPVTGAVVWTWPDRVAPPDSLRFERARVAVIAYGAPGRRIAAEITRRGGTPVLLGAAWFVAQARRQRQLWETAT